MGWGDVKLVGAMGAAFGFPMVMAGLVFISLVGALQALVALLWHGAAWETAAGWGRRWAVRAKLMSSPGPEQPPRHIPYGIAIAVGSFWAMFWQQSAMVR